MGKVYDQVCMFKAKYPHTLTWFRLKKHSEIVEKHLNPEEEPIYTFAGQKSVDLFDCFSTCVICLTNKRILIGVRRLIGGYRLNFITPDMFNDMQVYKGILYGRIVIDTVKETITISHLDKKCLSEVETAITSYMMDEKVKYESKEKKNKKN